MRLRTRIPQTVRISICACRAPSLSKMRLHKACSYKAYSHGPPHTGGNGMSVDLSKLSRAALSAAMRGGTNAWGQYASAEKHIGYVEPQDARRGHYRKCHCGCGKRAKFRAMFNGVCLYEGCEISAHRLVKTGDYRSRPREETAG